MRPTVKLLGKAALLALPFLLLVGAAEVWTGWDRSVYAQKKAAFERAAARTEVLVLGSSQSYYGVDPGGIAADTFNLAFPGQSLRYDTELLRRNLHRLPALRAVILPLSSFTMEYELSLGVESRRACNYRYHFGIPHESGEHRDEARNHFNFLLSGRQQGAGLMREKLRSMLGRAGTKSEGIELLDARGGLLADREPAPTHEDLEREAPGVVRMHLAGMRPRVIPRNVARLESLHRELKARGIHLVLFTPPVTRAYTSRIAPDRQRQWQGLVQTLAGSLQVPYKDYSEDARFSNADFRDCNHLNQAGRKRFTAILDADLIRPTLTRK
jgi:hypothetical protein